MHEENYRKCVPNKPCFLHLDFTPRVRILFIIAPANMRKLHRTMNAPTDMNAAASWLRMPSIVVQCFWFKCVGTIGFTFVFFTTYIYLLKHPAHSVTLIPETAIDRMIGVKSFALPFYLSLWVYISLPPMLMVTKKAIIEYGLKIGSLCLVALGIFYFWPTVVPLSDVDWGRYPGMAFMKKVDTSGNACPSLHVATSVFSCFWLNRGLRNLGFGKVPQLLSTLWCLTIVYSTLATKQHMAVDVSCGIALALFFVWFFDRQFVWIRVLREECADLFTLRNLLIALAGIIYLAIGFIATTTSHPPLFTVLFGFVPLATISLASAWKSKARAILLPIFATVALAILFHLNELREHAAWLYFIQHAGAMTLLFITFGSTLGGQHRDAFCSKIACFMFPEEPHAEYLFYTWKVTLAWSIYFATSAIISVALFFFGSIENWSVFDNVVTPVSLGAMFAGEYLIRLRLLPDGPKMSLTATIHAYREYSQRQN